MTEPTTERLAKALEEAGAPEDMITKAREGYYDDYKSPLPFPETQLYRDARDLGLESICRGVLNGDFDSTPEESAEWARSPEGRNVFSELMKGPNREQRRHPKN